MEVGQQTIDDLEVVVPVDEQLCPPFQRAGGGDTLECTHHRGADRHD